VTAVIEIGDNQIVWRNFGYQTNYETFDHHSVYSGVGPFTFDRDSYTAVLNQYRAFARPDGAKGDV